MLLFACAALVFGASGDDANASGPAEDWNASVADASGEVDDTIVIVDDNPTLSHSVVQAAAFPTTAQVTYASRLMLDLNFETSTGEDVMEWWHVGGLKIDHRFDEHMKALVDARARWGVTGEDTKPHHPFWLVNARDPKWAADLELREGFVTLGVDAASLHVGQRIFVWGKNEFGAAADVVNPIDLRYDLAGTFRSTRDSKVPVFAIDGVVADAGASVELVVLPFFAANKVFLFGRDFALAPPGSPEAAQILGVARVDPSIEDDLQLAVAGTEVPEPSPNNWSYAARGTAHVLGWDFGATVFYGWDRTPRLDVDPDLVLLLVEGEDILADPMLLATDPTLRDAALRLQQKVAVGEQVLRADFRRWWQFAFEAEGVVGDVVLRADLGFTPGRVSYDATWRHHTLPSAQWALGAEYSYGTTFFASLTTLGTAVFWAPAGVTLTGLERTSANPTAERTVWSYGAATVLRWAPEDWDATGEIVGACFIEPGDLVLALQLTYSAFEPHTLLAGLLYLDGPSGSLAGRYQRNSLAYAGYRAAW